MQFYGHNTIYTCCINSNFKNTCLHESDHKLLLCKKSASFKSLVKVQEETFFPLIIYVVCNKL